MLFYQVCCLVWHFSSSVSSRRGEKRIIKMCKIMNEYFLLSPHQPLHIHSDIAPSRLSLSVWYFSLINHHLAANQHGNKPIHIAAWEVFHCFNKIKILSTAGNGERTIRYIIKRLAAALDTTWTINNINTIAIFSKTTTTSQKNHICIHLKM